MRTFRIATLAALLVGLLGIGLPMTASASVTTTWTSATVRYWVDGDTVQTSKGRVRLLGVDTPEAGACGATTATAYARSLAPTGATVRLGNPSSVRDKDRYGRLLRYVDRGTAVDIANRQIGKGAKARYDSRDGYQYHPRQSRYRATDARYTDYRCGTSGTSSWQTKANRPISASNPELDCADIPAGYRPVRITGTDYHRLDADHDGWGCD